MMRAVDGAGRAYQPRAPDLTLDFFFVGFHIISAFIFCVISLSPVFISYVFYWVHYVVYVCLHFLLLVQAMFMNFDIFELSTADTLVVF